jgi:nesprin-1
LQDVDVDRPDERSVMTYVAQFVHKYPEVRSESGESIDKIQKDYNLLLSWLTERTQYLSWPQNLSQDFSVSTNKFNN